VSTTVTSAKKPVTSPAIVATSAPVAPAQPSGSAENSVSTLSFDVLDSRKQISKQIGEFNLRAKQTGKNDWDIEVTRGKVDDNLLAPIKNWHGMQPFQVYANQVAEKQMDAVREMQVRDTKHTLTIKMVGCQVTAGNPDAAFTKGTIEIYWKE
jgi:predicted membrane-bound mannosyltransferase